MKFIYLTIVLLIASQLACQSTTAQISAYQSATVTPRSLTPQAQSQPTTTSQSPKCYTVIAEEGLHVRALARYDSPILAILTAGQGVTVTNQTRDLHGNLWLFIGTGWTRADWMIETECKP